MADLMPAPARQAAGLPPVVIRAGVQLDVRALRTGAPPRPSRSKRPEGKDAPDRDEG